MVAMIESSMKSLQYQGDWFMRGSDLQTDRMFCYTSPEGFVPEDHPLRPIRTMIEKTLSDLSPNFAAMYSHTGRPSVPPITPAKLLRFTLPVFILWQPIA
jgi:hypothetical protein